MRRVRNEASRHPLGYLSPPPAPAPVLVYKDVGGLVSDYEAQTELYRRDNREVRLHECRSACTLALSLPNVCVYPDAKVKFHQAYNALNREVDLGVSARLFASYPAAVQARLGTLTRDYRVLTGTELIALGMRNCNGPGRQKDDGRVLLAARAPERRTQTASAAPAAAGAPNPFGVLAQNVSAAVARAWSDPETATRAPIRVAAAPERRSDAPALARLTQEPDAPPPLREGAAKQGLAETTPLPPRRPPSLAFGAQENLPPLARERLIQGAQPILPSSQFVLRGGVKPGV